MGSVASEAPEGFVSRQDLERLFSLLRKHKVSVGGNEGFFVSTKRSDEMRKALITFIEQSDELDAADVAKMEADLNSLRAESAKSETQLKELQKVCESQKQSLGTQTTAIAHLKEELADMTSRSGDYAGLKAKLAQTELDLGKAKVQAKAAQRGFDPDAAVEANDAVSLLKDQVKSLQQERKRFDAEKAAIEEKLAASKKSFALTEEALAASQKDVARLKTAKAAANADLPPPKVAVEIDVPMVRLLFGQKGLDWLSGIDHERRLNMRDYAHSLLMTANSSRATRGIGDLLHLAMEWIKTKAYSARLALQPWLTRIETDMRAGVRMSVSFYRDELRKIIGDYQLAKSNAQGQYKGKAKLLNPLLNGAKAMGKTSKRWYSHVPRLSAAWSAAKIFVRKARTAVVAALRSLWSPLSAAEQQQVERELLYDVESLSSEEKAPTSAPPPAPRQEKSGKIAAMGARLFK